MQTLLDPAILFFLIGLIAGALKSNLEIPPQISRFLSLYLLMALGLKGGFALAKSGLTGDVATSLSCAVFLAVVIPLLSYWLLRSVVNGFDAAAIAATYGSVSAVTFITATHFLEIRSIGFGGHMTAAMALMESPAIILAVLLANRTRQSLDLEAGKRAVKPPASIGKLLHESVTDGAQLLLLGALAIGMLTGEAGKSSMQVFSIDLFKGMLAFFLLDMGLLAARHAAGLKGMSPIILLYALLSPLIHASLAFILAKMCGLNQGDATLLMVLAASASYIAVPAAIRFSIPEANPSLYIGMSLALTFPFNLVIGIPAYAWVAATLL
jgi:hypothetical protein